MGIISSHRQPSSSPLSLYHLRQIESDVLNVFDVTKSSAWAHHVLLHGLPELVLSLPLKKSFFYNNTTHVPVASTKLEYQVHVPISCINSMYQVRVPSSCTKSKYQIFCTKYQYKVPSLPPKASYNIDQSCCTCCTHVPEI